MNKKLSTLVKNAKYFATMALVAGTTLYVNTTSADAATDALSKVGITAGSIDGDTGGLFSSLKNVIYVIMGVGGLWSVAWIVIGGMLLAGSGSNAQKRSGGMAAIAVAAVGVFIIYKANDIASWAVGLGATP